MVDEIPTPTTPAGTPETPAVETPKPDEKPALTEVKDLPEWAQTEITSLRNESANYRTKFRDAEAKIAAAKTPEEFETAVRERDEQITTLQTQFDRERVARKFNLPDDLAERLRGATPEELEADAKALQKYADTGSSTPPEDLKGGLTPDDDNQDAFDPKAAAKAALKRRYRL